MSKVTRAQRRALLRLVVKAWEQCRDGVREENRRHHAEYMQQGICVYLGYVQGDMFRSSEQATHPLFRASQELNLAIRKGLAVIDEDGEPYSRVYLPIALQCGNKSSGATAKDSDVRRRWLSHWADTGEALTYDTWSKPIRTRKKAKADAS